MLSFALLNTSLFGTLIILPLLACALVLLSQFDCWQCLTGWYFTVLGRFIA